MICVWVSLFIFDWTFLFYQEYSLWDLEGLLEGSPGKDGTMSNKFNTVKMFTYKKQASDLKGHSVEVEKKFKLRIEYQWGNNTNNTFTDNWITEYIE